MKKIKQKIISGALLFGCTALTVTAIAHISRKAENNAVPVAMISYEEEKPIIVLDAGHGEST